MAAASKAERVATGRWNTAIGRIDEPVARATSTIQAIVISPRTKISCAAGMLWLAYLTSASLQTKQAIAATMKPMPARLARRRSASADRPA